MLDRKEKSLASYFWLWRKNINGACAARTGIQLKLLRRRFSWSCSSVWTHATDGQMGKAESAPARASLPIGHSRNTHAVKQLLKDWRTITLALGCADAQIQIKQKHVRTDSDQTETCAEGLMWSDMACVVPLISSKSGWSTVEILFKTI
jgi:hypothetical protein